MNFQRQWLPTAKHLLSTFLLGLVLLWVLFPLWWAFVLSIKDSADFFTAKTVPFVQFRPTLANWRAEWQAFADPAGMGHSLFNSLVVATATSCLSLALGGLAAFGLYLRRNAQRSIRLIVGVLLFPRLMPTIVTAFPLSTQLGWLRLTDSLTALVIAHTTVGLALATLILYSAMLEMPPEVVGAAQLDGCSLFNVLRWIILPQLGPVLAAAGALVFAQSWNEFLFAVTNVQLRAQTAPLAIAALLNKDGIEFEYVGSHLLLVLLPPLVLALLAQRYLVRGLSLGTLQDDRMNS
jgi:multiple sugar transport system permease protein